MIGEDELGSWNPLDKDAAWLLSGGNLTATRDGATAGNAAVRGLPPISSGKLYWEVVVGAATFNQENGAISTAAALPAALESAAIGFGYKSGDGRVYINTALTDTLATYTTADVLQFALDLDNLKLWVRKSGQNWNGSGAANPATNTGGYTVSAGTYAPAASSSVTTDVVTLRTDEADWTGTKPAGFTIWGD